MSKGTANIAYGESNDGASIWMQVYCVQIACSGQPGRRSLRHHGGKLDFTRIALLDW